MNMCEFLISENDFLISENQFLISDNHFLILEIIFWYIRNYFLISENNFWHQKLFFDIRKCHEFLISETYFLISEKNFWYQKIEFLISENRISDIRKSALKSYLAFHIMMTQKEHFDTFQATFVDHFNNTIGHILILKVLKYIATC